MPKEYNLLGLVLFAAASGAWAHGVIVSPPSRNYTCGLETYPAQIQFGEAKTPACSTAFAVNPMAAYNYMAVLTHSWGRAEANPLPQHVCGFDSESWKGAKTPWDAAMEWPAARANPGPMTITWDITSGAHFADTRDFRYWITKADFVFSSTRELTWSDFEEAPFCALDYDDSKPVANPAITPDKAKGLFHTQCTVPSRQGHHVIYSEWGRVEPTRERFHGCIDLAFGNASTLTKGKPAKTPRKLSRYTEKATDLRGRLHHPSGRLWVAPAP